MPPSPRYTVRLPPALDARVQARVRAGTPFAVLIREALSAYLADTVPTQPPTPLPTAADSADMVRNLEEQLAALVTRVAVLEEALTLRRQRADTSANSHADTMPTGADTPAPFSRGAMRRRIVALLQDHPEGLSPAQIRDRLGTDRDLNNTCFAMARDGLLRRVERGRYVGA